MFSGNAVIFTKVAPVVELKDAGDPAGVHGGDEVQDQPRQPDGLGVRLLGRLARHDAPDHVVDGRHEVLVDPHGSVAVHLGPEQVHHGLHLVRHDGLDAALSAAARAQAGQRVEGELAVLAPSRAVLRNNNYSFLISVQRK